MQIDEQWNPTETDINEYAEYIGIDPKREPELLWLAREGIKAPLPPNWIAKEDENGDIFYVNKVSKEEAFDHPLDETYQKKVIEERRKLKKKTEDDFAIKPAMLSSAKVSPLLPQSTPLNPVSLDDNYVPSPEEIHDYAEYIGIDPIKEKDLLYIAEEGLKAPVPAGYSTRQTLDGDIEYINLKTQEVSYDHPSDGEFRQKVIEQRKAKQMESLHASPQSVSFTPSSATQASDKQAVSEPEKDELGGAQSKPEEAKPPISANVNRALGNAPAAQTKADIEEIPVYKERARAPSPESQLRFREEPEVQLSDMTQLQQISAKLQSDFANEVLRVTSEHADEVKRILRAQSVEIGQLNRDHQKALQELQRANAAEITEIRAKHDAEVSALRRQQGEDQPGPSAQLGASPELEDCRRKIRELEAQNDEMAAEMRQQPNEEQHALDTSQVQYLDIFTAEANIIIYSLPGPLKTALLHEKYIIYELSEFLTMIKPKIDLEIRALEAKRASFTAEMSLLGQSFDKYQEKVLYKERKLLDTESASVSTRISEFKRAERFIKGRKLVLEHIFDSLNILPAYPQVYEQCSGFASEFVGTGHLFDFAVERGGWLIPPLQKLDESLRVQPQLEDLQRTVSSLFSGEEKALMDALSHVFEGGTSASLLESGIYETIQGLTQERVRVVGNSIIREEEIPQEIVEFGVKYGLFERQTAHEVPESYPQVQEEGETWMDALRKELM